MKFKVLFAAINSISLSHRLENWNKCDVHIWLQANEANSVAIFCEMDTAMLETEIVNKLVGPSRSKSTFPWQQLSPIRSELNGSPHH